jgi:hypothetical protein
VNSKHKLYRFKKKIEALCISHNINTSTHSKWSSNANNLKYIKELILKLQIETGGQHVIAYTNISSPVPNINPAYQEDERSNSKKTKKKIVKLINII